MVPNSVLKPISVGLALLIASGCAHTVRRPLEMELRKKDAPVLGPPGEPISGFTTTDRREHPFKGYAILRADTVQFWRSLGAAGYFDARTQAWHDSADFALIEARPRLEVATLDKRQFSPGKTGLLVAGVLVACVVALGIAFAASDPNFGFGG